MGQLPPVRVTPNIVFTNVGVDYAGPVLIKRGAVRRPTITKAYIAVFVSLSVKAVHLELVSDLTTEAFLACLIRFVSRRGKPTTMWSDHGTNFVGANRQLNDLYAFLRRRETEASIMSFCGGEGIDWSFIQERAPHFGGLWEAAVKSTKRHLFFISTEYLTTLQKIQKWHSSPGNLKTGDIVVIRDVSLVPTHWPLAIMTKTYHGDHGVVRVVTVKTAKGTYNRPVHKIALLLTD